MYNATSVWSDNLAQTQADQLTFSLDFDDILPRDQALFDGYGADVEDSSHQPLISVFHGGLSEVDPDLEPADFDEVDLFHAEGEPDETLEESTPAQRGRRGRRGKHPEPPPIDPNGPPVSVYQRLVDYGLLRKLTGIVLAEVSVPWHLREDAIQEIHTTWASLQSKPEFARNQLARYAYLSGQHAALKLRRTIGAVVAIPGTLFRTGRTTSFMESIGAAVNPRDVEDFKDMLELSTDPREEMRYRLTEKYLRLRLNRISISEKHHAVAKLLLIERKDPHDVAQELNLRVCEIERMINHIVLKLNAFDAEEAELAQQLEQDFELTPSPAPKAACKAANRKAPPAASRASRARKRVEG